jgi:hypothetical protein
MHVLINQYTYEFESLAQVILGLLFTQMPSQEKRGTLKTLRRFGLWNHLINHEMILQNWWVTQSLTLY